MIHLASQNKKITFSVNVMSSPPFGPGGDASMGEDDEGSFRVGDELELGE